MAELNRSSPLTAKGSETRRRIFDAAVQEFSQNGFAGARIERIAEAAGVNKQRIYAYFGDKEGLFVEVWRQTSSLINEEGRNLRALGDEDIPRLGPILLRRYADFHENHPKFWRIFVLENLMGTRHHRRAEEGEPYAHIKKLYQKGQQMGCLDPGVSFESFLFVLIAVTSFYASNWKTMSETLTIDLSRPDVKKRIFGEIRRWLFGKDPDND
ncbi:MAG: TetR/AcrR family transcriptional regulator [Spirochaetaceae bacterium]|nr:TetR/AcrR family transcriptional regulator [Spirochaetaceae bacterium]